MAPSCSTAARGARPCCGTGDPVGPAGQLGGGGVKVKEPEIWSDIWILNDILNVMYSIYMYNYIYLCVKVYIYLSI